MLVAIIDYGIGNLTSVKNALGILGVKPIISQNQSVLRDATHLILPGVGSFGEGMEGLRKRGLVEILESQVLEHGKKLLGICLGMQLLASKGFEYGEHEGLGFIKGNVVKIPIEKSHVRLPHIGWNDVEIHGNHQIVKGFEESPIFYFVHSYHFKPADSAVVAGETHYGDESLVAIVEKENIFGVQFHPEKSDRDGLKIFTNFLES